MSHLKHYTLYRHANAVHTHLFTGSLYVCLHTHYTRKTHAHTHTHTSPRGVRQDHVRAVIADSALLSSMEMYAFLLRPGLAALDNLADKFVAGWLLPSKMLDLSYPTPPLPLLVFAIQSDEGRQLAGRSTASRRRYRGQDSILIILEYQSIITVEKLQLWCTNSGCNTRYSKILFTVVVESNAESILQGSLRFFLKPVQLHQQ